MALPEIYKTWREYHDRLLSQVRVLVVEDEAVVGDVLDALLSDEGFGVDVVETAEGAWARMESVRYDLVVTDKNLPGASGIELLARMKSNGRNIPSVLITGYASTESLSEAMRQGASDYIVKPFDDIMRVLERLRRVIDRRFSSMQYYLIVQELKASVAREELPPDVEKQIKGELFTRKEKLAERLEVMIVDDQTQLVDSIQRTLNANRINTEVCDHVQTLIDRMEQPRGPLAVLMRLKECESDLLHKLAQIDPLVEVLAFSSGSPSLETAVDAVSNGAADFALLGDEGLEVLKARVRRAVDRARRRHLHLHLVGTLARAGGIAPEELDELMRLLPVEDRRYLKREIELPTRPAEPPADSTLGELLDEAGATGRERRLHPRHDWREDVWVVYADADQLSRAYASKMQASNISRTGMFIEGSPPPLGAVLMVHVQEGEGYDAVVGRVVRHAPPDEPPGFGIEFLKPETRIQEILERVDRASSG